MVEEKECIAISDSDDELQPNRPLVGESLFINGQMKYVALRTLRTVRSVAASQMPQAQASLNMAAEDSRSGHEVRDSECSGNSSMRLIPCMHAAERGLGLLGDEAPGTKIDLGP
jgi:hypothetical protein